MAVPQHLVPIEIPARPAYGAWAAITRIPNWVPFMAHAAVEGRGAPGAVNGISFTSEGDLLLYRKIFPADWVRFSELLRVSEVWIEIRISWPDVV